MRTVENLIQVATQAQDPSVLDYFNWDEIVPDYAAINAVPPRWMNDMKKVASIRQQRQAQMAQEAQVRAAPGQAAMAKAAATVHEKAPQLAAQLGKGAPPAPAPQQQQAVA
jgi:hypothetical protein